MLWVLIRTCLGASNEYMYLYKCMILWRTGEKYLKIIIKYSSWKAPYSSKKDIFVIQERLSKLIYGTNMIIKCAIEQPVKF